MDGRVGEYGDGLLGRRGGDGEEVQGGGDGEARRRRAHLKTGAGSLLIGWGWREERVERREGSARWWRWHQGTGYRVERVGLAAQRVYGADGGGDVRRGADGQPVGKRGVNE